MLPSASQNVAPVGENPCHAPVDGQGFLVFANGTLEVALVCKYQPPIADCRRRSRIDLQRRLTLLDGQRMLPLPAKDIRPAGENPCDARVEGQRFLVLANGTLEVALVCQYQAPNTENIWKI